MSWVNRRSEFEESALRRGYSLDVDDLGRYEDHYLQEAWSIFTGINISRIIKEEK